MSEENKTDEPVECPECLEETCQAELDVFGGVCELCFCEMHDEESE